MQVTINESLLAVVGIVVVLVGPYVKNAIDLVRMAVDLPRWGPPLMAVVLGIVLSLLLSTLAFTSNNLAPTPSQILAMVVVSVFSGIAVAVQAVGTAQMHDSANTAVAARRGEGPPPLPLPHRDAHKTEP